MENNKTKIGLFKPHPGQKQIIDALEDPSVRYTVVCAGRRFGKSELMLNATIKFALEKPNRNCLIMTNGGDQRATLWSDLNRIFPLHKAPFIKDWNKTLSEIWFKNGSKLMFRLASYPSVENVRGKKFDWMALDEFALYYKSAFEEILQPTLATVPDFKVLITSTPRGKGFFWELFNMQNDNSRWRSFSMPSSANPMVSQEFLDDVRKTLPEKVFKQEYLAEFIDDQGELFENISECVQDLYWQPQRDEQYVAGIDLGFRNDYTVVTVLDRNNNVVDFLRFNESDNPTGNGHSLDYKATSKKIYTILKKWNFPRTKIETNKFDSVYSYLKEMGTDNLEEFVTTAQSKRLLIEHLTNLFATRALTLPNNPVLLQELSDFNYYYNPKTRNVSFSAPDGAHDDCVMSLGLAAWANVDYQKINW